MIDVICFDHVLRSCRFGLDMFLHFLDLAPGHELRSCGTASFLFFWAYMCWGCKVSPTLYTPLVRSRSMQTLVLGSTFNEICFQRWFVRSKKHKNQQQTIQNLEKSIVFKVFHEKVLETGSRLGGLGSMPPKQAGTKTQNP